MDATDTTFVPPVVDVPDAAARIKADPERLLGELASRYGDVFTTPVDGEHRMTYVLDPHLFHPLLTARGIDFSPVSRQSKLRFGLGSMVSTDEAVRALSHAMTGGLRGSRLSATVTRFEEELKRRVAGYAEGLGDGADRPLQSLVTETLMPASMFALFGPGVFDAAFQDDFFAFSGGVATRFTGSDPELAGPARAAERALMERLEPCLSTLGTPVLQGLADRLLATTTATLDERLRTLLVVLWGSLVNLVPTATWMLASTSLHPDLVTRLRTAAPDRATELRASVVHETLRVYSRPNMYRAVTEDFDLDVPGRGKVRFFAGDWIALFPRFLHHDEEVFGEPERFNPTRFCPAEAGGEEPRFSKGGDELRHPTLVFGAGRGRCPGDAYTLSILDRVLEHWTASFDIEVGALPRAITDTVSSTPGPDGPIDARLTPRK